jgi:hypothetical protein
MATYDGSGLIAGVNFYVNGVLVGTDPNPALTQEPVVGTTLSTAPLSMGARGSISNLHLGGSAEHTAIFNAELTGAQVLEVYNGGVFPNLNALPTAPAPIFWVALDDNDAQGANGIIDYGSGSNDGTASGGLGGASGSQVPIHLEPMFGPFTMQINSIAFNKSGCTFTAKPKAFNRARTGEIYDIGRFPMLAGFL